ncbi:IS3 family transposase [Lysinibacillus fusiformis]|nr:IS3 family transposase [Lysinibacillus fusiformis]
MTAQGFDSLRKRKRHAGYTTQSKLGVINYYLNCGKSIRDVAHKFNLSNDSMVSSWTSAFRKHGIVGISPKSKGRQSLSNKPKKATNKKIFQNMSRKGNCLDNSPMENFFGLLKQEMYHGIIYTSFEEMKQAIDKYIYCYNYKRIKSKFRCSPVTYRERLAA